jgi:hypothetical protein
MRLMKVAAYALLGYVAYELAIGFFEESKASSSQQPPQASQNAPRREKSRSAMREVRRAAAVETDKLL